MLVSYAAAMTGSREEAEEVAQEAFVRAWRGFGRFKGSEKGFRSWLRTITRNVVIDRYRRNRNDVLHNAAYVKGMEDVLEATDRRAGDSSWSQGVADLRDCLEALPEDLRNACRYHYFEGLSSREIASRVDAQQATILKRLERARIQLRKCVEHKLRVTPLGESHE